MGFTHWEIASETWQMSRKFITLVNLSPLFKDRMVTLNKSRHQLFFTVQSVQPGAALNPRFRDKFGKKIIFGHNFSECSKSSENVTNRKSVKFYIDLATRKISQLLFFIEKSNFAILMIGFRSDFNEKSHFNRRESPSVESRFFI